MEAVEGWVEAVEVVCALALVAATVAAVKGALRVGVAAAYVGESAGVAGVRVVVVSADAGVVEIPSSPYRGMCRKRWHASLPSLHRKRLHNIARSVRSAGPPRSVSRRCVRDKQSAPRAASCSRCRLSRSLT